MSGSERWASRVGLVLAMAGNAVGLGNFLRFPAQAAQNGGGAFLIPYFVSLAVVGFPLMWMEWTIGRYGGQFGHHSTPGMFDAMGRGRLWKYFGVFGLWNCLLIAAFYLYIESWCLAYAGNSLLGGFRSTTGKEYYDYLLGTRENSVIAVGGFGMLMFGVCILLNLYILSRGLAKGIEIVSKIGMPVLILFATILAVRGLMISPETDPHAVASPFEGLNFVWNPKFDSLLNPTVWLAAVGQTFFTLSIGMGSMHCYASYLRQNDDIALNGAAGAWTNEFCEVVLGGTILIPIAVAYLGLEKVQGGSGFGLGFMVFPQLFNNWGSFAPLAGFLWFGLLFFAAITSSLAMGQPMMAFLEDEFDLPREKCALLFGAMLLPLALPVALLHSKTFFDEFDFWAGTFSLVVMAVGEAILFSWVFGAGKGWEELMRGSDLKVPRIFFYIMKYVTPVFLIVILVAFMLKPQAGWDTYLAAAAGQKEAPPWEWAPDGMVGMLLHRDLPIPDGAHPDEAAFVNNLKLVRTVDRGVMIATFLGLAGLVAVAWNRRKLKSGAAA
ncbi:MAG TPA: sodium-dependent transporter [Planctomycetaceae bacterium]|nr:sodium-dependent transporter [Planctomycetaceae bacterium]